MIWFLERESDLVICEIRRVDESSVYEFEVAPSQGPARVHHFDSPTDLIDTYLREQSSLRAQGWRPRVSDIELLAD